LRFSKIGSMAFAAAVIGSAAVVLATPQAVPPPTPPQQPAQSGALVPTSKAAPTGPYQEAVPLRHFQDGSINESSGVAAARRNPGLLWTHNDSGDKPHVYAVDREGVTVGLYQVRGARNVDWEDMAVGPGPGGKFGPYLYLGDIGDNARRRTDCVVYRIQEPKVGGTRAQITKQTPRMSEGATLRLPFRYPDGPRDAEALLVHSRTGAIYIVSKEPSGRAGVYKFPARQPSGTKPAMLVRVGTVMITGEQHPFPNVVTGGDIAPDGRKVILCTYAAAYELTLPAGAANFEAIWKTRPAKIALPALPQCEAVCYTTAGKSILVTSAQTPAQIYRLDAKQR